MDKQLAWYIQPRVLETYTVKPAVVAAGVIFLALDTQRCLMQLRNSDKRFKHTWGFFGGMCEKGETPYEALQRELVEEIGFMPELSKLNPIDIYESKDKQFYYYSFAAVVANEFSPNLNKESAGYAWVNIGNWPQPLHQGARVTLGKNKGTNKLEKILEFHS
jgi:8-oxo-dGTP pyrophosphatase MutT (NUDIX family)